MRAGFGGLVAGDSGTVLVMMTSGSRVAGFFFGNRLDAGHTSSAGGRRDADTFVGVVPATAQDAVQQHRQEGEQTGNAGKHLEWSR
jgi:hypothetical protein